MQTTRKDFDSKSAKLTQLTKNKGLNYYLIICNLNVPIQKVIRLILIKLEQVKIWVANTETQIPPSIGASVNPVVYRVWCLTWKVINNNFSVTDLYYSLESLLLNFNYFFWHDHSVVIISMGSQQLLRKQWSQKEREMTQVAIPTRTDE